MKQDVLLTIAGWHREMDKDWNKIEIQTTGTLFEKEHALYLVYDEVLGESEDEVSHTRVKITENPVEVTITKSGLVSSVMSFAAGSREKADYETPFGVLPLVVKTTNIFFERTEKLLDLKIVYELDMNYEHVSDSVIKIKATPLQ